jgi:hypothetical protein
MVVTGNSSINVYNNIYISGNPVLTGVIPTPQTITNVVYTTGDQTISGSKTFAYPIVFSSGINDGIYLGGAGGSIDLRGGDTDYSPGGAGGNIIMRGAVANGKAGDINTSASIFGGGGNINTAGGGEGSPGGNISTNGGAYYMPGGSINTSNGGGNIYTFGNRRNIVSALGGNIYLSGKIDENGNDNIKNGGSINLSAGGGNIESIGGDDYSWSDGENTYFQIGGQGGSINLNGQDAAEGENGANGGSINTSNGGGNIDTRGQGHIQFGFDSIRTTLSGTASQNRTISLPDANGTLALDKNILYTTGNQTISGIKTFDVAPILSGNPLITGVNLSSYITTGQTGVFYPRNNPSGFITSADLSRVVYTTGNQTISGNKTFAQDTVFGDYTQDNLFVVSGNQITFGVRPTVNGTGVLLSGEAASLPTTIVYATGNQTISGVKTFANTGSFDTLQITNKKLSSYNYINSNFTFGDAHINIVNSSNNIIGTLPSSVTSGINYYVKNLNSGILLITGSGQRTIDGFSTVNLYKNESLQLLGVNNIGYTGWISLSVSAGVS